MREDRALRIDEVVFGDIGQVRCLTVMTESCTGFFSFCTGHYFGVGDCAACGGDDVEGLRGIVGCWTGDGA